LSWGGTAARWSEDELLELASQSSGGAALVDELVEAALLVETPCGGFRTRAAETVRLIASLRQSFPSRPVTDGRGLILDYRFLHRPRRRPSRNVSRTIALKRLETLAAAPGQALLTALLPEMASEFQIETTERTLSALKRKDRSAVVVTAGTGSGKTLAFYLPVLTHIASELHSNPNPGVLALAIYPRNELLKDQLRTVVSLAERAWQQNSNEPAISVGNWFGLTPTSARDAKKNWKSFSHRGSTAYKCPFLTCLDDDCLGRMAWKQADLEAGRERLTCLSCGREIHERFLRLTRQSAVKDPPALMLTTTESLNRQLANPRNLRAFGIAPASVQVVLLDELHIYEGTTGAQNAYLFRRLKNALKRDPVWVALSATLANADEFLSQCVGVPKQDVTVVSPDLGAMDDVGAEYLLALRHNPASGTGTLSTTIQTCFLLTRCLDVLAPNPYVPPPSSSGVTGSKVFAFTDKLDVTNRLYWDLMSAEGWAYPGQPLQRNIFTLAHLRSCSQGKMNPQCREPGAERDLDGQWWWLPELLGHGLDTDRQLGLGRTSSQDRGVSEHAELIIATSTLEVGFDDATVGAVIQHKAPHSPASFIQRKGRAGRDPRTRPWTVVVLSDWGRDQSAWDAYDLLFDPDLPARSLPLDNRYVQRIQTTYILLEWISREVSAYSSGANVWSDLAAPATVLTDNPEDRKRISDRQAKVRTALESLLVPGPHRNRLRRYIRGALGLATNDESESIVDSLLWDGPRPLLLAVVPTMVRRLRDDWALEEPARDDPNVRNRVPLRDFAPGNLFDDLLGTDTVFRGPGLENVEAPFLPALRTIRDFIPGTVSRHFGIRADNKRHWIAPALSNGAGTGVVDVQATYNGTQQTIVAVGDSRIPVFAPTCVTLTPVPRQVRDHSRIDVAWESSISAVESGFAIQLPESVRRVFEEIVCHLHSRGGAVRQVRFARRAAGTVFTPDAEHLNLRFVDGTGGDAALGTESYVDGVAVRVNVPACPTTPSSRERTAWLHWYLLHTDALPQTVNRFSRDTLAAAAQVIWCRDILGTSNVSQLSDASLSGQLAEAAFLLGRLRTEVHGDVEREDEEDAGHFVDDDWLRSDAVIESVRMALEVAGGDRTREWSKWAKRRYTLTAASVLLRAGEGLSGGIDPESLVIDIDEDDDQLAWITETSPGGIGAVEAFSQALVNSSHLVSYAIATAVAPTDLEQLDDDLLTVVERADGGLRSMGGEVLEAWRDGHQTALAKLGAYFERSEELGVPLHRSAKTALATRLLGPGAHPQLFDVVSQWMLIRDRLSEGGVFPSSRVLAAVLASESVNDDVLRLPSGADGQRRSRAISNILWPSGSDIEPNAISNPFADLPAVDLVTLRGSSAFAPVQFPVDAWNADVRSAVHARLLNDREVCLRFDRATRTEVRRVLLDLQTAPIEDGTVFVHPEVVAVVGVGINREIWLRLRGR
jgi:hypothetical protein